MGNLVHRRMGDAGQSRQGRFSQPDAGGAGNSIDIKIRCSGFGIRRGNILGLNRAEIEQRIHCEN